MVLKQDTMHYFIHGEYHLQSRAFLRTLINQAKSQNKEVIYLDGVSLSLNELIQATTSNSLFGNEKTVVIENLFSRLKSKDQEKLLEWLHGYNSDTDLILWEKKNIGKIAQRKLPVNIFIKEFKTPAIIFKLVELLSPSTKPKAVETLTAVLQKEPAEFIFLMIVRQLRQLLLIKNGQEIKGAPWMIGKLKKQAADFESDKLLASYQKLYIIDKLIKTGQTLMPLEWHLSVWITEL